MVLLEECSPITLLTVARQKRSPPSGYGRKDLCGNNLRQARHADTALFWIPAFAGMTSCPPFDGVYPELVEGLRTGSGGHPELVGCALRTT